MSEALVLVMDGRGEEESGTIFRAAPGELEAIGSYDLMKSLGALYEFAIQLLGYRFGDEYKVMGLAPYGNPQTYRELFDTFYTLEEKGDYEIHPLVVGIHPVSPTFFDAGFLPRRKGEPFTQQHKDFAAGLQEMLEKIVMHVVRHAAHSTGLSDFCFVGGSPPAGRRPRRSSWAC
jgi:predicted NodU family carbamoyl transferase